MSTDPVVKPRYYPIKPAKFIGQYNNPDIALGKAQRKVMEGYRAELHQVGPGIFNVLVSGKMDRLQPVGFHIQAATIFLYGFDPELKAELLAKMKPEG